MTKLPLDYLLDMKIFMWAWCLYQVNHNLTYVVFTQ